MIGDLMASYVSTLALNHAPLGHLSSVFLVAEPSKIIFLI